MVSKCFLGDLKKREIYIIGSSKKKIQKLTLQVASTPFQITYLQKYCFLFNLYFGETAITFYSYFEFLPCL